MIAPRWTVAFAAFCATQALAAPPDFSGLWESTSTATEVRQLDGSAPPLLPAAAQLLQQNQAKAAARDRSFDPIARCLPPGTPRIYSNPEPFLIVQRPTEVLFLFQFQRVVRRVFMQSQQPSSPELSFMGSSVAHWEDATLVIDTMGFKQAGLLDDAGTPFSEQLHVTERWRLRGADRLEDRVSIEDPAEFSAAWQTRYEFRRRPGTNLAEDVCADRVHPERLHSRGQLLP